jgi:hypothetical protein
MNNIEVPGRRSGRGYGLVASRFEPLGRVKMISVGFAGLLCGKTMSGHVSPPTHLCELPPQLGVLHNVSKHE